MKVLLGMLIYLIILKIFLSPLIPFFIAIFIYILLRPFVVFLSQRLNIKKNNVSFIVLFIFFLLLVILFVYTSIKVYLFVYAYIDHYSFDINQIIDLYHIIPELHNIVLYIIRYTFTTFSFVIASIPSIFLFLMVLCLASFYLFYDQEYIKNMLMHITRLETFNMIKKFVNICNDTILQYCKIQCIIMIITFIVLWIVFIALDIKYALVCSVVLSVLDCLPFLGVGIGLLPLVIYYLYKMMYVKVIYLILVFLFLSFMRSIIETHMMKQSMKIPSFIILLSMIMHLYVYGISGIILSILHMNIIFGYLEYRKSRGVMI